MFPQFFEFAGAQTPLTLVFLDLICTVLIGGSVFKILRREWRRRQRRKAISAHYARSLEDFPELTAR